MRRLSLTAIVASHNRKVHTLACLDSLHRCEPVADLRVILFDDGSTDGTAEAVAAQHPAVTVLRGDGTAFWAGGMRAGFTAAVAYDPDFYLWLNDDVSLLADALRRLLDTHHALAGRGQPFCLVGGAVADRKTGRTSYAGVRRPFARRPLRFRRHAPHPARFEPCDTLVGNVVLIPRAVVRAIGGIDPVYRHTLADLDYGLRVTEAGGCCVLAPGHIGWCAPNRRHGRWFNPDLPLAARWRLLTHPLGFPLRPWLHFARRHGGPAWVLFAVLPFWRLFVPLWLARMVDRRRIAGAGHLRHA